MNASGNGKSHARRQAASCFVIATRNRPAHLVDAVRSVLGQTVLPAELCIVDASVATPARDEIEALCARAGVTLAYVHPAPRGLTIQRNLGIERTTGDPVFLIDDDVWMEPDAHEQVLAEYDRWGPELGGVRGAPLRPPIPHPLAVAWRKLFGMGGWWPEASGKVRGGFFAESVVASADTRRVEAFTGWFMSFRRDVFEHERFDENLGGYALKEDMDFSYRVARRGYVLVQTPRARIEHRKTVDERLRPYDFQRMDVANQLYLHRKNMPQTFGNRAALWWAMLGYLGLNLGHAVRSRDRGYVTGMLVGLRDHVRGRRLESSGAEPIDTALEARRR